jgi:hypothetical protein
MLDHGGTERVVSTVPGRLKKSLRKLAFGKRARLQHLHAGLLVGLSLLGAAEPARSQASERPSITIPATITAEPLSQLPFPIGVGPMSAVPPNTFLRIRGLPSMVALSDGHSIAPGSWAVALKALPALKILLPVATDAKSEFVVSLVALDGSVLDEKRGTLIVLDPPKPPPSNAEPSAAPPGSPSASMMVPAAPPRPLPAERPARPASPAAPPAAMLPQDRERAMKLTKEGDTHMSQGNIAAARLVYELASDMGFAPAAMALGGTYDSAELARFNVRGIEPNAREAQRWYERARQLGAADAEPRLQRLGAKKSP